MRWDPQKTTSVAEGEKPPLLRLTSLVRSVTTPEFEGVTFHEVLARSALNHVPLTSRMLPGAWTINPYRGCSHACLYCYARSTHRYLDLDAGADFDSQIVVKVNVAEVLARELSTKKALPDKVALGTNTDPYQRAEGRYALMPGVITALAAGGVPFSILTKGTLLRRDLSLLSEVSRTQEVSLALSVAIFDEDLQQSLEPGTPTFAARLATVRMVRDRGMSCGVFLAPILPGLTDGPDQLDRALGLIREAGATSVFFTPLRLGPDVRDWFLGWLARERPELLPRYHELYGASPGPREAYGQWLTTRMRTLLPRHGLVNASDRRTEESRTTARAFSLERRRATSTGSELGSTREPAGQRRVNARADAALGEQPRLF